MEKFNNVALPAALIAVAASVGSFAYTYKQVSDLREEIQELKRALASIQQSMQNSRREEAQREKRVKMLTKDSETSKNVERKVEEITELLQEKGLLDTPGESSRSKKKRPAKRTVPAQDSSDEEDSDMDFDKMREKFNGR